MTARLRTAAELDRLRTRRRDPAFEPAWAALLARAETALAEDLRPVGEAAGWGHGYYCPDHVVPLEFDSSEPEHHRCPVDGVDYTGPVFDGGWRCALNSRILDGLTAGSTVWAATGDLRHLDHVRTILLDYAARYPRLPDYGIHVGKGRVTGQSLEEAVWAISVARAFDTVAAALPAAEADHIRTDLLSELGTHLTHQLMHKIHNIECWHLAALATVGVACDDEDLVTRSLTGDFGLPAQLADGILDDGWWAEGSPSYHFYMLASVLNAAIALRGPAPGFLETPGLRKMFAAPLTLMRSDLSLPALNDGWNSIAMPLGLGQYAGLYEQAYGLWAGEDEADFLRELYGRGVARTSDAALTMGPDLGELSSGRSWPHRRVHPSSGYAVLADGTGPRERSVLLKYGPHGGGHGHPDKLELDLHAYGVRLAPDAGSPAYISELQGPWVRQTLSHNTVVLGTESQPEAEGTLIAHLDVTEHPVGLADAVVSWPSDPDVVIGRPGSWLREPRRTHVPAYAGARIRRTLLWRPAPGGYLIDLVSVETPTDVPIDLAWHHRGVMVEPVPATLPRADWSAPTQAYEFLDDVRILAGAEVGEWSAGWSVDGAGTRMWAYDPFDARAVVATSPSNPPAERQSTVLRRANGRSALFAAVIEPVDGDPMTTGSITGVDWGDTDDSDDLAVVTVQRGSDVERWTIRTGDEDEVVASTSVGGTDYEVTLAAIT